MLYLCLSICVGVGVGCVIMGIFMFINNERTRL